jgi:hypothetical protein
MGFDDRGGLIVLPTWRINTLVESQDVSSSANIGTMKDFVGVIRKNHVGHGMPDVFADTDKVTTAFTRVRGKASIIQLVVHRLPPLKTE